MSAQITDDANLGLFVGIEPAEDYLLLCGKCVLRNNARAIAAQQDRLGLLGKHLAFHVAANQQNCNFFRNSAAAAHAFCHSYPTLKMDWELARWYLGFSAEVTEIC